MEAVKEFYEKVLQSKIISKKCFLELKMLKTCSETFYFLFFLKKQGIVLERPLKGVFQKKENVDMK